MKSCMDDVLDFHPNVDEENLVFQHFKMVEKATIDKVMKWVWMMF